MLIEELRKRRNLILSDRENSRYIIYPISKQEADSLQDILTNPDKKEQKETIVNALLYEKKSIDMIGHKLEVLNSHLSEVIPDSVLRKKPRHDQETEQIVAEYHCYESKTETSITKHQDKASSFRCACGTIQTEYFIVIKELKK